MRAGSGRNGAALGGNGIVVVFSDLGSWKPELRTSRHAQGSFVPLLENMRARRCRATIELPSVWLLNIAIFVDKLNFKYENRHLWMLQM